MAHIGGHEELSIMTSSSTQTLADEQLYPIFRVPPPLRTIAPAMFTPRVVAIGPLHSPAWNIPTMSTESLYPTYTDLDKYKLVAWHKIFKAELPEQEGPFLHFLYQQQESMLASYGGRLEQEYRDGNTNTKFVQHIALDACFTAAILHSLFQQDFPHLKHKMVMDEIILVGRVCNTAHFYPIFARKLSRPMQKTILEDMLLVENQIPLIAVKQAVKIESNCRSDDEVDRLLELYVAAMAHRVLPFSKSRKNVLSSVKNASTGAQHLLDMMYSIVCMHRDVSDINKRSISTIAEDQDLHVREMPGASKLHMSGVKLHGHWGSLTELSFHEGRLSLPKIHVGDDTEQYFRNLLAYESCFKTDRLDILSYLHFMDFLVDTPADVELLMESKIITESIGSNEKVAEMWNSLCRNTMCVFSPKHKAVADSVQSYCKSPWRVLWAEFYRSNLAKPWLVASLLSAAALLIMTLLILLYTVLIYHHDKPRSP